MSSMQDYIGSERVQNLEKKICNFPDEDLFGKNVLMYSILVY